ncbi:MAG: class I SAM-dependent methyltransferase [Nanoarchaeota archaeon]|nr:class I SAM-dependent methyltransferase [Nanoarchaeota archaeon]
MEEGYGLNYVKTYVLNQPLSRNVKKKYYYKQERKYISYFKNCRSVLDVACGEGTNLLLMKKNGINARGIDLTPEFAKECRSKGLNVIQGDALQLNKYFKKGEFDGILCSFLVEHLTKNQIKALFKEMNALLAQDGLLTINYVKRFYKRFQEDPTHKTILPEWEIINMLIAAGFKITKVDNEVYYFKGCLLLPTRIGFAVQSFLGKYFSGLAIIHARKIAQVNKI